MLGFVLALYIGHVSVQCPASVLRILSPVPHAVPFLLCMSSADRCSLFCAHQSSVVFCCPLVMLLSRKSRSGQHLSLLPFPQGRCGLLSPGGVLSSRSLGDLVNCGSAVQSALRLGREAGGAERRAVELCEQEAELALRLAWLCESSLHPGRWSSPRPTASGSEVLTQ